MPLEDYSCYAFPALRALEGYIKYLFGMNIGLPRQVTRIDRYCSAILLRKWG